MGNSVKKAIKLSYEYKFDIPTDFLDLRHTRQELFYSNSGNVNVKLKNTELKLHKHILEKVNYFKDKDEIDLSDYNETYIKVFLKYLYTEWIITIEECIIIFHFSTVFGSDSVPSRQYFISHQGEYDSICISKWLNHFKITDDELRTSLAHSLDYQLYREKHPIDSDRPVASLD
jgi:hypothetical protein